MTLVIPDVPPGACPELWEKCHAVAFNAARVLAQLQPNREYDILASARRLYADQAVRRVLGALPLTTALNGG